MRAKRFSRKIECGIPIGRRFFIAARSSREGMAWFPVKVIFPTFTVGPSLMMKLIGHRGGWNGLDVWLHGGKLVPVFGQQGADHIDRPRQPRGIVRALDRKADVLFLEAVENVRGGDRVQALVVDLPNGGLFFDDHVENDALGGIFPGDLQILEVSRVP